MLHKEYPIIIKIKAIILLINIRAIKLLVSIHIANATNDIPPKINIGYIKFLILILQNINMDSAINNTGRNHNAPIPQNLIVSKKLFLKTINDKLLNI